MIEMEDKHYVNLKNSFFQCLEDFSNSNSDYLYETKWTSKIDEKNSKNIYQQKFLNLNLCSEKFLALSSTQKFIDNFLDLEFLNSFSFNKLELLKEFIRTYFFKSQNTEINEEIFNECYSFLEKSIVSEYGKIRFFFTPLYNFDTELEEIEIENFKISKISPYFFDRISSLDIHKGDLDPELSFPIKKIKFVLSFSTLVESTIDPQQAVFSFMCALRLTNPGDVKHGHFYDYHPLSWQGQLAPGTIETEQFLGMPYVLRHDDISRLKMNFLNLEQIWATFDEKPIAYLNYAIRRFDYIYDNKLIEDQITDLMISLESLLNVQTYDVTDRVSLRASMILENDDSKKMTCLDFIKSCYGIRSEIVHGKIRKEKIREIMPLSEDKLEKLLSNKTLKNLLSSEKMDQIKNGNCVDEILSEYDIFKIIPNEYKNELTDEKIKEKLESYVRNALVQILKMQIIYSTQEKIHKIIDHHVLDRNTELF